MPAADVLAAAGGEHLLRAGGDVPGLRLLLDDDALGGWLAEQAPGLSDGVRRTYVRFKPGAGGVARVDLGPGHEPAFLAVVSRDAAAKVGKTVSRGGPEVLVADGRALAVLATAGADRDLPGLVRVRRRGVRVALAGTRAVDDDARLLLARGAAGDDPTTLAWKPQRRWVGLLDVAGVPAVVLRAYRRDAVARARAGYDVLGAALPGLVPEVLATDARHGLLAVTHLPGTPLDRLTGAGPGAGSGEAAAVVETGRLVARLHAARPPAGSRPAPSPRDEAVAVTEAAALVDLLVPGVGAQALARRVTAALAALTRADDASVAVLVHGDLSADQVLVRPDGSVALLDLDQAGVGPAALDLASAAAAWWAADSATAAAAVAALHEGYNAVRALPDPGELRVRTAGMLLRRAPEPFRHAQDRWPEQVVAVVDRARALLDGADPT